MHQTELNLFSIKTIPDLETYDRFLVAFSGGKDSICCVLTLLDMGVEPCKIELHHHLVDAREGSDNKEGRSSSEQGGLFDWPVTEDYCRQFAKAFDLKIYFSWLEGGLEREMCRKDQAEAPTYFETPEGLRSAGGKGEPDTRRKFPGQGRRPQETLVQCLCQNRCPQYQHQ